MDYHAVEGEGGAQEAQANLAAASVARSANPATCLSQQMSRNGEAKSVGMCRLHECAVRQRQVWRHVAMDPRHGSHRACLRPTPESGPPASALT